MIKIHWLSPYQLNDIRQIKTVNLASMRLRAGALLSALVPSEHQLTLGGVIPKGTSVCVIGKLGADNATKRGVQWLAEVQQLRQSGGRVILDYTDDHLAIESPMSPFYREVIKNVDMCVCSSRLLARSLGELSQHRAEIIPDAIEISAMPPAKDVHNPLTLLWFGHPSNLKYLVEFLPRLQRPQVLKLLILTNVDGIRLLQATELQIPSNLQIECVEWSIHSMHVAASLCDLCIIPSAPDDRRKAGASSNRLLTAFALGLPTAAERLDSYIEHEALFADIRSPQFDHMLENPAGWHDAVIAAQTGPLAASGLLQIGQQWLKLINELMGVNEY